MPTLSKDEVGRYELLLVELKNKRTLLVALNNATRGLSRGRRGVVRRKLVCALRERCRNTPVDLGSEIPKIKIPPEAYQHEEFLRERHSDYF